MSIESVHWHTLHPRYLNATSRVLDLGANYGHFAGRIMKRFGCRCVAVEPSPEPFHAIQAGDGLEKHNVAITPTEGQFAFNINEESTASSLLDQRGSSLGTTTVTGVTLEAFVRDLGWDGVDLLKVDIEGAEIEVLNQCNDAFLQAIQQISIEFHDFNGLTPRAEVRKVIQKLERLGFYSVRMSRVGHQDTWLINRRTCPISTAELLYIKFVLRYWLGCKRVLGRLLRTKQ